MHSPGLDIVVKEKDTLLKQQEKLTIDERLDKGMN